MALENPDEAARWAMFHLQFFLTHIANAIDPLDERLRRHRVFQLYVALIGLYYQFLRASNFAAVANLWDALLTWHREFGFDEAIETIADRHGLRPAIPKPF
jgi:hypothetical protein